MAIPRETGLHFHAQGTARGFPHQLHVKVLVNEKHIRILRRRVGSDTCHQPRKIRRTTRAAHPFSPYRKDVLFPWINPVRLRPYIQRIHIEEALAVQRDSRQHTVIEFFLQDIRVPGIRFHFQHPPCKKCHTDAGAGLRVRRVIRKIIRKGKGFADMRSADPSGHVHVPADDVIPQALTCLLQGVILIQARVIRHSGIQVNRAHRMSLGFALFPDRPVGLMITEIHPSAGLLIHPVKWIAYRSVAFPQLLRGKAVGLLPSLVDKVPSHGTVFFLPGFLIEPGQRHLRDLMARDAVDLIRPLSDSLCYAVRVATGCIKKRTLSGRLVICDGSFRKMAEAVQFMEIAQVCETL